MVKKENQTRRAAQLLRDLGYITETDLAGIRAVTLATLRNQQSAGNGPPRYKVGKRNLYRLAEVEAWLARSRVSAPIRIAA